MAIAWAMLLVLSACRKEPPEQALRNTISAMETAAEAHDTDALFEPIADDFAGSEGMDRQAFRRYVTFMGMRSKSVGVQLGPLDVKLYDQRATVSFTAALSGGEGLLPSRVQVYDVDTGWRLDDGEWKLISAKWKPQL
ncbi:MAG: nuclear transport factor 2 family protein [Gammaproteobacteria bacterium]|nr:nuclear transport factor 2 family protein [Gammaproteobacteria bacterium]